MFLHSHKINQFYFVLIKLSIVVGAFYFIYSKLLNNDTFDYFSFYEKLNLNHILSLKNLIFLVFLSFLNWFFEILKWQHLVSVVEKISFKKAAEQSLASLTVSLITPNRIGEYGAKAIYFKSGNQKKILLLTFLSNSIQMAITICFGVFGLYFLNQIFNPEIDLKLILYTLIIVFFVVTISGFGLFKIKWFNFNKIKEFLNHIPTDLYVKIMTLSLIRYAIFSFQFYILLLIFGIELSYFHAMILISSMYFMSSIIPSILLLDVVVKSGVAVYLFSLIGVNELSIICIVTLMWILNFVIPSIIGSYFVLNFKFLNEGSNIC